MKDLTKELTIEQKAQRYDEAIDVARKIINGEPINAPDGTAIPVVIFPELDEPEDEKIRKVLIGFFKNYKEQGTIGAEIFNEILTDKILVWLEKQGEKKSVEWSEDDATRFQRIIDFLWYNRKGDTDTIYQDIDWLKTVKDRLQSKQGEQNTTDDDFIKSLKYNKV